MAPPSLLCPILLVAVSRGERKPEFGGPLERHGGYVLLETGAVSVCEEGGGDLFETRLSL